MSSPRKNKVLYGTAINLLGLYSKTPLKLHYNTDTKCWWDSRGSFKFESVGLARQERVVKFVSKNKEDVRAFITGVESINYMLKNFIGAENE